jgi:hypothetical protein
MPLQTIYVELLEEGVNVWRPVEARAETDHIFRLPDQAPPGETWRLAPGTRVRCEYRQLADEVALVAVELAHGHDGWRDAGQSNGGRRLSAGATAR